MMTDDRKRLLRELSTATDDDALLLATRPGALTAGEVNEWMRLVRARTRHEARPDPEVIENWARTWELTPGGVQMFRPLIEATHALVSSAKLEKIEGAVWYERRRQVGDLWRVLRRRSYKHQTCASRAEVNNGQM